MSGIKLKGSATGTGNLDISAPSTNTNRTLNLPDLDGTLLTTDGDGSSLQNIDALPSQTGHAGKYLTTDGASTSSWVSLNTDANKTTKGLYEMANTISIAYSIQSGNNAMSAGPITVDNGATVTIPTGSVWTIV